jgi:hypothetical protein
MSEFTILNDTPFIGCIDNFLSVDECNKLIELGKLKQVPSEIFFFGFRWARSKYKNS